MKQHDPIRDAVRFALSSGVAASLAGALAVPQLALAQDDEDVADQGLITVTGSRIQRVDIEGPSPVSVISREDIDATGDISVAEVLRGSTFNQFGSFKTRSGSSAQSQSTVSLRGLGATRTLILLDGRRIAGSPTFGAGSAQNLNTIPIEAVERIEVLRDGASAIYGADAIGGVVNVILRKDYEGLQLNGHIGRPTNSGGDEDSYGLVGGISSGKGNITFALDHEERDIIFNGDRSFSAIGLSAFGFPASFFAFTQDANGDFVSLGTFADPNCPTTLGTDATFPDSQFAPITNINGTPIASVCQFNYAATSATEAEFERDSFFVNGNYQVTENVGFFARGTFSKVDSFGRYAPTPFTAPFPTISAANPNNPTAPGAVPIHPSENNPILVGTDYSQYDVDGDGVADFTGPFDLTLLYRNLPGGFRDSFVEDTLVDFLAGFNGTVDLLGGMDWEFAGQHSEQTSNSASPGLGFVNVLQAAIDDGSFDVFGVNAPVDFSSVNPAAVHTGLADNVHRVASVDGQVTFDVVQMPSGPLAAAVGFEYRDEKFGQDFDDQQVAGNVAGSAGAADVSGARAVTALFAEVSVPILDTLEMSIAGRYDDYNDFGTTFNPKVAVGFRPIDSVLLRASYGEGFRAPSMSQLYSAPVQSFDAAIDTTQCFNSGDQNVPTNQLPPGHPCLSTQYQNFSGGNTQLDPELSENLNLGVVWNPLDDLSISVDYFDIELVDQIATLPLQAILDNEFTENMGGTGGTSLVSRLPNGNIFIIFANNQNIAATETQGYDVDTRYGFSFGAIGDFQAQVQLSKVTKYVSDLGDGNGFRRLQGTFDPDLRAAVSLGWSRGDFSASILGNHVTTTSNGAGAMLSSWTTWDASVGWATPWNGKITVGARNLFDRDPPTTPAIGNPNYTEQLHDVFGRVPFVRYEQNL
ncbi:MAG TPA: TonB-dependent receptor [Gammaproteobacteria bacterium]|nr:TonB-dependent receptor [Gammaproteobacteria bacterium]